LESSLALLVRLNIPLLEQENLLAGLNVFPGGLATFLDDLLAVLVLLLDGLEPLLEVKAKHLNVLFGQLKLLLPFFFHRGNLFFQLIRLCDNLESELTYPELFTLLYFQEVVMYSLNLDWIEWLSRLLPL
jgi:hypothetical protein